MIKKPKNDLEQIIFESNRWRKLAGILVEQEETQTDALDAPAPDAGGDTAAPDAGGTGDAEPGLDLSGGDLGTGEPGLEGDAGADGLGDDAGADIDTGGGGGGGIGGFGGMSGGGGFGDDGDSGIEADQPEEEEYVSTIGPEDVEIPADPVMAIVDDAIELLNVTRQPQKILQNVKHSIQRYFSDVQDATPIIKSLWDTEDVVLRDVAKRLLLFIKGI